MARDCSRAASSQISMLSVNWLVPFLGLLWCGTVAAGTGTCKCTPLDKCWPSEEVWNSLNNTVSGRLVKSVPIAAPCHDPTYDEEACDALIAAWYDPLTHIATSSSIQSRLFAGDVCSPFTPRSSPCTLGRSVAYAINVTQPEDVAAGLAFAEENNIRIVIRNTGHDLLGKSNGYGALAIWTHHLKSAELIEYSGKTYSGPAFRFGAGIQGYEALSISQQYGKTVVTGECPTVGLAGYTLGGGHSAISSMVGLGADQALEFEVVLANGTFVTACDTSYEDLRWALSGGGGGTFGVVTGFTVKTYDTFPASKASLSFAATSSSESAVEAYWDAVKFIESQTPSWNDDGDFTYFAQSSRGFAMTPLFAPNKTLNHVKKLMKPVIEKLDELEGEVAYSVEYETFATYLETWTDAFDGPKTLYTGDAQYGSRLIPRSVIERNLTEWIGVVREIVEDGGTMSEIHISPTLKRAGYPNNAVNPAWRDAAVHAIVFTAWDETLPEEQVAEDAFTVTYEWDAALRDIAGPNSGAYMNEADVNEPNWQSSFLGVNYQRLLAIKRKYDPDDLLYAKTAVGSEVWAEDEDGRLCRVKK